MIKLRRGLSKDAVLLRPIAEGAPHPSGFAGRQGQVLELSPGERWIGADHAATATEWEGVGAACIAAAGRAPRVALDARELPAHFAVGLGVGAVLRAWRFEILKARRAPGPRRLELLVDDPAALADAWARAEARLSGVLLARELVAEPANRLTPKEFARRLRGLESDGIEVEEFGRPALRRLGAGGILAVGGGSAVPPRIVVLRWKGGFRAPPVAFVGKGLCFDTGGISIKGAAGMEAMRADMAGAAACAGAMLALARRKSPCPAVAILAIAENMTSGSAYRPGDVLRMMSGRTVEVVDTDAEGRLVLADALHLAVTRFRPQAVLDLATLTGSVITALGHHRAGLFHNDAALGAAVAAAGEAVGERLWPLPIGGRHREELNSDIADLRQCVPDGTRFVSDASNAAAFLREFVGTLPWAHLDIAGMDTAETDDLLAAKGTPTGFGVRLLDALVERHFEDPHRV
ncbi:leucyl aminopeptidase family protein [Roseococcus sp. SYP-B2431]|uniref:leucyl aminopeptidase family protein n=1 Tax=Roseococcus sp. SYP-B2431 TaxID=2496640 RepID=UPI00103B9930|nr:leucyl aminopeptidase family protein [Roseococcus sp. SYP-B2431]TCH98558.1 leucyl aminopeptidase family protein [Roseococcus sp. SYP-B2431]